jgi:SAM-dependent methyltransferase
MDVSVFGAYSRYYNLLYKDKDYAGEANYVSGLIRQHRPGAKSVLDLGCGTGQHAFCLAEKGYTVTGVDRSAEMLAVARAQLSEKMSNPTAGEVWDASPLAFLQGDLRSVRLNRTFDVVVSLFHVMSYQTGNDDLRAAFATAHEHLGPGGVFIFDSWYGPGVLTDRPAVRVKRMEDDEIVVTRIVEPAMFPNENLVETNYQIMIRDKANGAVEELYETHRMRYLFRPEVALLLEGAGMELVANTEWMTEKAPEFSTWGACFVARKTDRVRGPNVAIDKGESD